MKKKALSLLLSSAMVVSLAACGSSSDSSSTATDSNATSTTEAANAEASTTASTGETSSYDLTELNIVVNGTLTATVDNGQQAFVEQWEKAISEELGHDVKHYPNSSIYGLSSSQKLTHYAVLSSITLKSV